MLQVVEGPERLTAAAETLSVTAPVVSFTVPPAPLTVTPPAIPLGLPSGLVEMRPDVAAAERRMAAANAQVGVATAAFFPSLTLTGSAGYQASSLTDFFSLPNRFWSLGPAFLATLFDGGRLRAVKAQAVANYDRPEILAQLSEGLSRLAMKGISVATIPAGEQLAKRGW